MVARKIRYVRVDIGCRAVAGLAETIADSIVRPGQRSPQTVALGEEILIVLVAVSAVVGRIQLARQTRCHVDDSASFVAIGLGSPFANRGRRRFVLFGWLVGPIAGADQLDDLFPEFR